MRPNLKLLAALLVNVWRAVDGEDRLVGRQRNRPGYDAASRLDRPDYFFRALIDQVMIVGFQFDSNLLHV